MYRSGRDPESTATAAGVRGRRRAALLALAAALAAPEATAAPAASPLAGIWAGTIDYAPAELEIEVLVEIGEGAAGELVGTADVPIAKIRYRPLENLVLDGAEVGFDLPVSFHGGGTGVVTFRGTLDAGGGQIAGQFHGWKERGTRDAPFRLVRVGEPGGGRLDWGEPPELHDLSAGGEELAAAFDADRDRVRLILTLSPT